MTIRRFLVWEVIMGLLLMGCLSAYPSVPATISNSSPTETSRPQSDLSTPIPSIATSTVFSQASPIPRDTAGYSSPTDTSLPPSGLSTPDAAIATWTDSPQSPATPGYTSTPSQLGTRTARQTVPPVASAPSSPKISIFGVETDQIDASRAWDQVSQTGTRWVRRNAIVWSDIEPTQGARMWNALAALEAELRVASSQGMQVIMIVRGTPSWAQKVSGFSCGAVREEKLAAFGRFMRDAVARYGVAPYNVKYWEVWNEPDIDPSLVAPDSAFGCWGDQNDSYYGGGYYAQMLKVVYPQIKSVDPQSQVVVGGFVLDCDPRSVCSAIGHNDKPPKFLEGLLRNGGGPFFDGIGFHAYDYYYGGVGKFAVPNWNTAWNTTGPTLVAKSNFIKGLLSAYGVSGKFLMNTETALICNSCNSDPIFENTKAFYVVQVYAAAIFHGLRANIWYSVLGWRNSGLLSGNMSPLPAFSALKFASVELSDARPIREINEYPGIKGYDFNRGDRRISVLWSLDGDAHVITLPGPSLAIYGVDGASIVPSDSLSVTLEPLYLEQNP